MTDSVKMQHIINGEKVTGTADRHFEICNPATGKCIRKIQGASVAEVDLAVAAAKQAGLSWREVTPSKRAQIMFTYRDLIIKNLDELAKMVSEEHGKTLADAKGEVMRGVEIVEFCTAINSHLKSDYTASVSDGIDSYNMRFPLGVCAGITPFNFPSMVPMWMYPVAIACGNTFVLKLSEKDPSAGLRLTELMEEAGLPKGVLNTIVGDKEAVDAILHHPDIRRGELCGLNGGG